MTSVLKSEAVNGSALPALRNIRIRVFIQQKHRNLVKSVTKLLSRQKFAARTCTLSLAQHVPFRLRACSRSFDGAAGHQGPHRRNPRPTPVPRISVLCPSGFSSLTIILRQVTVPNTRSWQARERRRAHTSASRSNPFEIVWRIASTSKTQPPQVPPLICCRAAHRRVSGGRAASGARSGRGGRAARILEASA